MMTDTSGHVTNVTALTTWMLATTGELQFIAACLGIFWLALQITLKLLSLRKKT